MIITPDEKVTLFNEEFIIEHNTLSDHKYRGFHNDICITKGYTDKFQVLQEVVIYYKNNFMKLEHFIENINEGSKMWVNEDPSNRFIAPLSEDVKYWNAKGINTVKALRHYLDNEFEFMT